MMMLSRMIIVHHLNDSRSQRVLWLLEELELPYEIKIYHRMPDGRAPKELREVHPLGKSPIITDTMDDKTVTVAESGAIIDYLIRTHGQGRVDPPEDRKIDDIYYSHFAEGSLMPPLVNQHVSSLIPDHVPFFVRPLVRMIFGFVDSAVNIPNIKHSLEMVEAHLSASPTPYFCGGAGPTSADFMMSFPLEFATIHAFKPDGPTPAIKRFLDGIRARPAYQKAFEKGGTFSWDK